MVLRIRRFCEKLIVATAMLVCVADVHAQVLEPRLYSNAPVGLNFLIGGYAYSIGGAVIDPTVALEDAEIELHIPVIAYARSLGLWGKSAKFDVVIPYGFVSGSATLNGVFRERKIDGIADPQFRFSMNFFGAPALTLEDFKNYTQNFILGASLKVTAPLGQYDNDRLLNIGTNRWSITPELGFSKTIGPVILELAGAITFFTDNNSFLGRTREQAPMNSVQGHVVYTFGRGIWIALDGTYFTGGRTTVDGVEDNNLQQNSRLGTTLAFPVDKHNSVKLFASTGVSTRTGSDFDTYGLVWQYRWGGGL